MVEVFPAHITLIDGLKSVQTVREHLYNTAAYAKKRICGTGFSSTAYLAGLVHDMGKYTDKFRCYIEDAADGKAVVRGSVNHTFCGAIYILERYADRGAYEKYTAEIIAYAVSAHHGETDAVSPDGESAFEYRINKDRDEIRYDEAVKNFLSDCASEQELDDLFLLAVVEITSFISGIRSDLRTRKKAAFLIGMAARTILSAVVDGDRRDTSEFMNRTKISCTSADKQLWENHLGLLDKKISGFDASSPINNARRIFSDICRDFGERYNGGIYRLTLPTGAGKTLSSLRFALTNAAGHSKKRIIFVIPLLSILEQNSAVIRQYIDDDSIITEHHSNIVRDFSDKDELDRYELLTQTWESPIIVTTLVQLLNTLFSGKMSSVRRMGALADSVIVIDEIQSLPKKAVHITAMALNYLAYSCNSTVVLSSATQPVFELTDLIYSQPSDIVPFDSTLFGVFKRTEVIDETDAYGMNADELADFAEKVSQNVKSLLVICNTKNTAVELYRALRKRCGCEILYLSASMCSRHRTDVLCRMHELLRVGEKLICVSTQIIEAGVDVSFESVIRITAGIDNIAQAAGRCNRNNDFGGIKNVYVVNLRAGAENLKMLEEIAASERCTAELLARYRKSPCEYENDILSEKCIKEYYTLLFGSEDIKKNFDYPAKLPRGNIVKLYDLLSDNPYGMERPSFKGQYLLNQAFATAGELFEVFDESTTDVIVPYNDEAREIIADIFSEKASYDFSFLRERLEMAKKYTIRLFEYQRRKLSDDGMLIVGSGRFTALNELCYNNETGLEINNFII